MHVEIEHDKHHEQTMVLVTQLVRDTMEVLEQYGLFSAEQNRDIAKDLLFRICAVLDGSSFPGRLGGEEISPFVGFYLEHQTDQLLVPENGSSMHAFVQELVDAYHSSK